MAMMFHTHAAGTITAEKLYQLATDVVQLGRQQELHAASEQLAELQTEADRCLRYIRQTIESLPTNL